jgi:hypothetical protein
MSEVPAARADEAGRMLMAAAAAAVVVRKSRRETGMRDISGRELSDEGPSFYLAESTRRKRLR